jgi:hypothetical protein
MRYDVDRVMSARLGRFVIVLSLLVLQTTTGLKTGASTSTRARATSPPIEPINPFPSLDTSTPVSDPLAFNLQNTASANRDVDEVFEGACPIEGTVRDLKYVCVDWLLAQACYIQYVFALTCTVLCCTEWRVIV